MKIEKKSTIHLENKKSPKKMIGTIFHKSKNYRIDFYQPIDISIPLSNDKNCTSAWYVNPMKLELYCPIARQRRFYAILPLIRYRVLKTWAYG
jgi:hypothetical protein